MVQVDPIAREFLWRAVAPPVRIYMCFGELPKFPPTFLRDRLLLIRLLPGPVLLKEGRHANLPVDLTTMGLLLFFGSGHRVASDIKSG